MNGLSLRDSRRIIEKRRKKLQRRLRSIQWEDQHQPMLNGSNIHYEMSEKVNAISCGGKCKKVYRMVVVRKNLSVEKGQRKLFDDVRYFFYITTRRDLSVSGVVKFANKRCDQENVIEQLKNGVNAMRMPVRDLNSNWAYMIIAALAWNLKA